MTEQAYNWFIIWPKSELFLVGLTQEIPGGLPSWVANRQNAVFTLSCLLKDSAIQ